MNTNTAASSEAAVYRLLTKPLRPSRPWLHPVDAAVAENGTGFGAIIGTMDLEQDIEPVTALKRGAADLIARASERHSPIVITQNGKPTAVLQDVRSYQRQQRALHLLKLLAQGGQDYDARRVHDRHSVDATVAARLAAHREGA